MKIKFTKEKEYPFLLHQIRRVGSWGWWNFDYVRVHEAMRTTPRIHSPPGTHTQTHNEKRSRKDCVFSCRFHGVWLERERRKITKTEKERKWLGIPKRILGQRWRRRLDRSAHRESRRSAPSVSDFQQPLRNEGRESGDFFPFSLFSARKFSVWEERKWGERERQ